MNRSTSTPMILLALVSILFAMIVSFFHSHGSANAEASASENAKAKEARDSRAEPTSKPFGLEKRVDWTTSKVIGSPEPPPAYRMERVFPKLNFTNPTIITSAPGTDRFFVAEQRGKVYSFPNDPNCDKADLMLDVKDLIDKLPEDDPITGFVALYGLTFHPNFAENRYCYVCYVVRGNERGKQKPDGTRVTRFKVTDTDPPVCIPESEKVIITWLQGGHNGGCIKFGLDGHLYISSGDGSFANPPDALDSGQDVSNLLCSVMRIDVDHEEEGRAYTIPKDNPFVDLENARGEVWAYGFRNPWKMSFDRETGELWVGDVGWELWELVYNVKRGGNYGWSIVEGRQQVHPERKVGPTPILPPTIEIPHTDGASVTGGFVYRGKKLPNLVGTYVFGDWETRRIWGSKKDPDTGLMTPKVDLVEPTVRLVGFAEDNDGELFAMDYDSGTIHEFVVNDEPDNSKNFPRNLSQTGLFESLEKLTPSPGVLPFEINAPQWADFAEAVYHIGLPEKGTVQFFQQAERVPGSMFKSSLVFPKNAVLAKTISIEMKRGDASSRRNLETQLLHFDGRYWRGYSYLWNDEQTDARLVEAAGHDMPLTIEDEEAPGGVREQTWHVPSRMECIRCHNPWAENTLAFEPKQLNRERYFGDITDNQLRTFEHLAVVSFQKPKLYPAPERPSSPLGTDISEIERLVDPHDESAESTARARSYLHANCAHCHRTGGGGAAYMELRYELDAAKLQAVESNPTQGTFGITEAKIIAAADPYRSTLFYRISKVGSGRMPHIGSEIVDTRGVALIEDWIRQLPVHLNDVDLISQLRELDEETSLAREKKAYAVTLSKLAVQVAAEHEREEPNDEDVAEAERRAVAQAAQKVVSRAKSRKETIEKLLEGPTSAMMLARNVEQSGRLPAAIREQVIAAAMANPQPAVRDLFESFIPADQRPKRLGNVIRPEELLALAGDAKRGRELFLNTAGIQCKNCHKLFGEGKELGPDLSKLAEKQTKIQILESILEPSKKVDQKYVSYLVETLEGKIHTGLLVDRTTSEIVLRNAKNELVKIPADDIDLVLPQRKSLMPELLLKDMTAQQVADLLALLTEKRSASEKN